MCIRDRLDELIEILNAVTTNIGLCRGAASLLQNTMKPMLEKSIELGVLLWGPELANKYQSSLIGFGLSLKSPQLEISSKILGWIPFAGVLSSVTADLVVAELTAIQQNNPKFVEIESGIDLNENAGSESTLLRSSTSN